MGRLEPWLALCLLAGCQAPVSSTQPGPVAQRPPGLFPGPCRSVKVDDHGERERIERIYDGERLVTEVEFSESGSERAVSRRFVYDEQGRQVRIDEFEAGQKHSTWLLYDDEGRWIASEVDATGNHDLIRRTERGYDNQGRASYRRVVELPSEHVIELHTFEHDERGRVVAERIEWPRADPPRSEAVSFRHDDLGRVTERIHRRFPQDTLVQRDVYAYGPSSRLASLIRHGEVRQTQRFEHDAAGNLLRIDYWDEAGAPVAATVYDYSCW